MKLLVATTLAFSLLTVPAEAATAPTIAWGPCSDQVLAAGGAQCGTLDVPMDPADPSSRSITLAVSRVQHKTAVSKGTVIAVADPYTGSGYQSSLLGARMAGGDSFDWVGFARRGQTPSVPALACTPPDHFAFNRPSYIATPITEPQWTARVKNYADACAANQPSLLEHMKTVDTAADMDLIRAAVGADRVSLFAQAYGTYTAEVYASRYSSRVQRMVLDTAIDPARVWYQAGNLDQDQPMQRDLELWFDFLASQDSVYHLGTTKAAVQQVWYDQLRKVSLEPADGVIGYSEWIDLFLFTAFTRQTWELLGGAFSNWVHNGDGATLRALFSQFYLVGADNTYGTLLAQMCTDAPWPASWTQWRNDTWSVFPQARDTAWGNTWFTAPCLYWHAKPGTPVAVGGTASTLLVTESLNVVASVDSSLEVRSRFPNSALVTVPGGISFANALTGNACVDGTIATFLAAGTLPTRKPGRQPDATC
ncbi:alpha/beta fold hydrolase [Actinocrispum sp. NPDC049592]|uniref:alpha/beta fold hydrolase n=1 Tax=Actinocrispum sp. NPDC049592 TaxID=3154835 RepID=UPI00343D3F10